MSAQELEVDDRVKEIIRHERAADNGQATVDKHRWEAARLISEELASGTTQRELATMIDKKQSHVSKCAAIWRKYSQENIPRPSWAFAYSSVSSRTPKAKPDLEPEPTLKLVSQAELEPEPEIETDKEAIARYLTGGEGSPALLKWLESQGEARMTRENGTLLLDVEEPTA